MLGLLGQLGSGPRQEDRPALEEPQPLLAAAQVVDQRLEQAGQQGIKEIVLGMAHRGRLNVLAHVLYKPYAQILAEFKDPASADVILTVFGPDAYEVDDTAVAAMPPKICMDETRSMMPGREVGGMDPGMVSMYWMPERAWATLS